MPMFSGDIFEVLIGMRVDPLWRLLSKVGLLYALEPIFTVIFVVNMNTVWEKVMSTIRALIFRSVLIQKAEVFDQYKVLITSLDILFLSEEMFTPDGCLIKAMFSAHRLVNSDLLTSDMGSLKNLSVRTFQETVDLGHFPRSVYLHYSFVRCWNNMHSVHSGPPACTNSGSIDAYCVCFSCCIQAIECACL